MEHPPRCRCPSCHPFAPGSDAEAAWLRGDRVDPTRHSAAPQIIPSPASYTLPVLPGDLEVLAARAECARALGLTVPGPRNDATPPS